MTPVENIFDKLAMGVDFQFITNLLMALTPSASRRSVNLTFTQKEILKSLSFSFTSYNGYEFYGHKMFCRHKKICSLHR